jgi:hypothetical protein
LASKLGVGPDKALDILHAPRSFSLSVPPGVSVRRSLCSSSDIVLAFFTTHALLSKELPTLAARIYPAKSLWIAWPKKTSRKETNITDHVVRSTALSLGLVDNKVCAIDETWTALRLVWRVERRNDSTNLEVKGRNH